MAAHNFSVAEIITIDQLLQEEILREDFLQRVKWSNANPEYILGEDHNFLTAIKQGIRALQPSNYATVFATTANESIDYKHWLSLQFLHTIMRKVNLQGASNGLTQLISDEAVYTSLANLFSSVQKKTLSNREDISDCIDLFETESSAELRIKKALQEAAEINSPYLATRLIINYYSTHCNNEASKREVGAINNKLNQRVQTEGTQILKDVKELSPALQKAYDRWADDHHNYSITIPDLIAIYDEIKDSNTHNSIKRDVIKALILVGDLYLTRIKEQKIGPVAEKIKLLRSYGIHVDNAWAYNTCRDPISRLISFVSNPFSKQQIDDKQLGRFLEQYHLIVLQRVRHHGYVPGARERTANGVLGLHEPARG